MGLVHVRRARAMLGWARWPFEGTETRVSRGCPKQPAPCVSLGLFQAPGANGRLRTGRRLRACPTAGAHHNRQPASFPFIPTTLRSKVRPTPTPIGYPSAVRVSSLARKRCSVVILISRGPLTPCVRRLYGRRRRETSKSISKHPDGAYLTLGSLPSAWQA